MNTTDWKRHQRWRAGAYVMALALCLTAQGRARGQALNAPGGKHPTFAYTVGPGDTCSGLAKRFFDDRKRYDLLHEDNPNMGPAPHRLEPGTVLNIRILDGASPEAIVTRRVRRVQARAPGTEAWREAEPGEELFKGWHVNTLARSQAEVTFQDESRLHLRENTLIIVYGGADKTLRKSGGEAFLERGDLRVALGDLRLKVTTASAEAQLKGGAAVVSVGQEGDSRVSNFDGGTASVALPSGKGRVRVKPGFGSVVDRGKPPSRPKRLPAAPDWASPPVLRVAGLRESGGIVQGTWQAVTGAHAYQVEIRDTQGSVVAAHRAGGQMTRFELHRVPIGTYEVRVSTIDSDQLESRPSDPVTVHVTELGLREPGQPNPTQRPFDPGDPSMDPTPTQVLAGTELLPPDNIDCRVWAGQADGSKRLFLRNEGRSEVLCTDRGNGQAMPGLPIEVVAPQLTWAAAEATGGAGTAPTLTAGQAHELAVTAAAALPLPATSTWSATGVAADVDASMTPNGFALRITPGADAAGLLTLHLHGEPGGPALATLHAVVVAPPTPAVVMPAKAATRCRYRCTPEAGRLELGLGLSGIAMAVDHRLYDATTLDADTRPTIGFVPGGVARLGYYPFEIAGLEVEGGALSRPVGDDNDPILLWFARTQLVAQLDTWVAPFVLAGVGYWGVSSGSDVLGEDTDFAFHYGTGLKFHILDSFGLRLDLRHVISEGRDAPLSHHFDTSLSMMGVLPL